MKTDNQIANESNINDISKVALKVDIKEDELIRYGNDKAKIIVKDGNYNGKLILVTSVSPTPSGEGKTTCSIGLVDGLNKIGKKTLGVLREPSMGPVFGSKGGAAGGGYSQLNPMVDINLHFTGDMHSLTSANNLICAYIDNHIYNGNKLNININNIIITRCLDINDRTLRNITIGQKYDVNGIEREEKFQITVATELMAILCLSLNLDDFKNRLNKMIVAYTVDNKPIYLKDLNITDSILVILKDTIKPNLVQTLENNPVIIHGGPFANIAHGCNSLIATNYALSKADYVVTEAGFGADLGCEKFYNIKCRTGNLKPDAVVIVSTIKSIKMQDNIKLKDLSTENIDAVKNGFVNLQRHLKIASSFCNNVIVTLNKFDSDSEEEVNTLKKLVTDLGFKFVINNSFKDGSSGAVDFANEVVKLCENNSTINYTYNLEDSYETKINKVCSNIYGAKGIKINKDVLNKLDEINLINSNLPICIAKTPVSFTGNKNILGAPTNFEIEITDVKLNNGAGFAVIYVGNIMTMPGLPKVSNAEKIIFKNNTINNLN